MNNPETVTAALTLLSAGLQRFIQVIDGPINRVTFRVLKILGRAWRQDAPTVPATDISQVDPARIAAAKAKVIILISFAVGTYISFLLDLAHLSGLLYAHLGNSVNLLYGLMISGGAEGTNSVVKYLQAAKEVKQQAGGIS